MELYKVTIPETINFLNLDDIASMRTMVEKELKRLGFDGDIFEASNVAEAEKVVGEQKVDFIISDWNLPDGTGFDFLKKIRQEKKYQNTPFLMVTTRDAVNDVLEAVKEGASTYLIKPWKPEDFAEKLSYAWSRHNKKS